MNMNERCRRCVFRGRSNSNTSTVINGCDYILLTGKMRGCSVEGCIRYLERSAAVDRLYRVNKHKQFPLMELAYPGSPIPTPAEEVAQAAEQQPVDGTELMRRLLNKERRAREAKRSYYEKNKERIRQRSRQYQQEHREERKAYLREYKRKKRKEKQESQA